MLEMELHLGRISAPARTQVDGRIMDGSPSDCDGRCAACRDATLSCEGRIIGCVPYRLRYICVDCGQATELFERAEWHQVRERERHTRAQRLRRCLNRLGLCRNWLDAHGGETWPKSTDR